MENNQPTALQALRWKLEEFEQSPPELSSITRGRVEKFIADNDALLWRMNHAIEWLRENSQPVRRSATIIPFPNIMSHTLRRTLNTLHQQQGSFL